MASTHRSPFVIAERLRNVLSCRPFSDRKIQVPNYLVFRELNNGKIVSSTIASSPDSEHSSKSPVHLELLVADVGNFR